MASHQGWQRTPCQEELPVVKKKNCNYQTFYGANCKWTGSRDEIKRITSL